MKKENNENQQLGSYYLLPLLPFFAQHAY